MGRRLVIGDIHGKIEALQDVLKKSKFNYNEDTLIVLGDIADGGYNTAQVIDELLKIKNLVFVIGNHDCVAEDTEILTNNGWIKIQNYSNEKIACFDNNHNIFFKKPLKKIETKKQEVINIEAYNTKQIVSYNHEVIVNNKKIKAQNLFNLNIKHTEILTKGIINNRKCKFTDNEIEFLTWIITDACIYESSKMKKRIQFKLSKTRKINKLIFLLQKMNIDFTIKKATMSKHNKLQPYFIRIYGDYARKYIKMLNGEKVFPYSFINMNMRQYKIFKDTLSCTDGHIDKYNKMTIVSVNKKNIDIIQIIAITHKDECKISKVKYGSGFDNGKQQYLATIYGSKNRNKINLNVEDYGVKKTYSFTMPFGTLITRNDGKIAFTGNSWFMNYLFKGRTPEEWINQGGANTLNSYGGRVVPGARLDTEPVMLDVNGVRVPKEHAEFFANGVYYFKLENKLFVHGGLNPNIPIESQDPQLLMWDRSIIKYAETNNINGYDKVFVGHTSTQHIEREWVNYQCRKCGEEWDKKVEKYTDMTGEPVCPKCKSNDIFQSIGCTKPIIIGNLYCLDTGAGWDGKLTIMDIDSKEYWQSQLQETPIR